MSKQTLTITVNIDNQSFKVKKGLTILEAAEQKGIYIPRLCSHKDLTPYGGCRICIVEVKNIRGFLTSCTTPVEDGMIIKTNTSQLQSERMQILQLILSEHTSSCLICDEKEECEKSMSTQRKVGVVTGCRFCPNDRQCELQEVAEKLNINQINYPVYYRNIKIEKEDPFYDRDYNLCILCGRCIRICKEVRLANTISFVQRGKDTIVGPAFKRTHLEAGCEFCGACVSVCPTGALSEKIRKWEGKPEREVSTLCPLCGIGCSVKILVKNNRVIGSLPDDNPQLNNGQLCMKGRFCINELVNNYDRLRIPFYNKNNSKIQINWEKAIEIAAGKISNCKPDEFALLVSANCCNEDLYIAQKFVRVALRSNNIDSSSRLFYGPAFNAYLQLFKNSVSLKQLKEATHILCIGLDTRYGQSILGVELRKAMKRKAKIITIHPRDHNLVLFADKWIQPKPGDEINILKSLINIIKNDSKRKDKEDDLIEVGRMLKKADNTVILIGSEILQYEITPDILKLIKELALIIKAGILPLPAQNNLLGSIFMGTYSELLPGGYDVNDRKRINELRKIWGTSIPANSIQWNSYESLHNKKLKVFYLIGVNPLIKKSLYDFLIFQNMYPPDDNLPSDLILPSAAFTERNGSYINGEGRVQRLHKAVDPEGEVLPDWKILCLIAQKMGKIGFDFTDVTDINKEISNIDTRFKDIVKLKRQERLSIKEINIIEFPGKSVYRNKIMKDNDFMLHVSFIEHDYYGFPLSRWVEGAREIFHEKTILINTEDAKKVGVHEGDQVIINIDSLEKTYSIRVLHKQTPGILNITLPVGEYSGMNPCPVKIRKKDV